MEKLDKRLKAIIRQLKKFSSGDYGDSVKASSNNDEIDKISNAFNNLGASLAEKDTRINSLLNILLKYTIMDFSEKFSASSAGDDIDALGVGLNALSEELNHRIIVLHEKEEQINTIFENAPDAVIVMDSKGLILRWNPVAESIFGWRQEDVMGKPLHTVIIPARYRDRHTEGIKTFLATGKSDTLNKTIQLPALKRDNSEIEMELTISPAKLKDDYLFIAFLRDITERRQAEKTILDLNATLEKKVVQRTEALRESERKYRNLFKNNPMPMWVLELPSLKFLDVNDAATRQYGYTREEFLSMTAIDIRPPEDKKQFIELDRTPSGTRNRGVWKHIKKDGSLIYVEVSVHEIRFDTRQARLVLSNDVTEKQKMQDEILKLNRDLESRIRERTHQLEVANKELESFSYSVSHDLRAPLRAIHGYSQMLSEDYEQHFDHEGKRQLNNIKVNARKMGQLVDDLLEFSRMGKRELNNSEVDLDALVESLLNELNQTEKIKAQIILNPLGKVTGDSALLHNVFQNLILNAIKYSSKREQPVIEIGAAQEDVKRIYYIKDNGAGFDMAYYNKLFGVFQRLHGHHEFEGTGVGLAIVQRIISTHGGKIWAEAKVNEGATFYFTLSNTNRNTNNKTI